MGYPLKKILASLPPGPRPPIFIGVAEPLVGSDSSLVLSGELATVTEAAGQRQCVRDQTVECFVGPSQRTELAKKLYGKKDDGDCG